MTQIPLTARLIADQVQGDLRGDETVQIDGVASLAEASHHHLSFLGNDKYRSKVLGSQAGVTLVPRDFEPEPPAGRAFIACDNPSEAFSQFVIAFAPAEIVPEPGVHRSAVIAPDAVIPATCHIGPYAVIQPGVKLGEKTIVEAGCYIGHQATIGEDCRIYPNVSIRERCRLGNRVIVHCGTVIGSDGFGFDMEADNKKIPQFGIVQIDDDVELGACVTVDRARFGRTWIKRGVKVDNLVQIAHNVVVGERSVIVAQVGIAGSTIIGNRVILAGQAGLPGHIEVGDGAVIMAKSGPLSDVEPGAVLLGIPGVPRREFMRQTAYLHKLPDLAAQVKLLEKEVARLKARLDEGGR